MPYLSQAFFDLVLVERAAPTLNSQERIFPPLWLARRSNLVSAWGLADTAYPQRSLLDFEFSGVMIAY